MYPVTHEGEELDILLSSLLESLHWPNEIALVGGLD